MRSVPFPRNGYPFIRRNASDLHTLYKIPPSPTVAILFLENCGKRLISFPELKNPAKLRSDQWTSWETFQSLEGKKWNVALQICKSVQVYLVSMSNLAHQDIMTSIHWYHCESDVFWRCCTSFLTCLLIEDAAAVKAPLEVYCEDGITTESDIIENLESPQLTGSKNGGARTHQMTDFRQKELKDVFEVFENDVKSIFHSQLCNKFAFPCKDMCSCYLRSSISKDSWTFFLKCSKNAPALKCNVIWNALHCAFQDVPKNFLVLVLIFITASFTSWRNSVSLSQARKTLKIHFKC